MMVQVSVHRLFILRFRDPHLARSWHASWIRRGARRGEWSGTGAGRSGCDRSGCSLRLSTLLGGSCSSPAALGKSPEAHAYDRAIGLAEDPAVREFLTQKRG